MKEVYPGIRELAVLQQATQMILSAMDLDTVLHQILLIMRNYFKASKCAVYLVDSASNELYCRAQNGYGPEIMERRLRIGNEGIPGWVAHNRSPLYVPDVSKEPLHPGGDPGIQSELALPLVVRDQTVGVLDIVSDKVAPFSNETVSVLSVFAGQAAIALENARLVSTERRRMRQIELINLIARSAAAANHIHQFLGTLAELIYDTFEGTEVLVVVCEPDGTLFLRAHAGTKEPTLERLAASYRDGILAQAFARKTTVVVDDVGVIEKWPACFADVGSELCAPLISLGEPLGAIIVAHEQPQFFSSDDRAIAQAAADVSATAARNVQLTQELRRVANSDILTGSYNQRYFHNVLEQELARGQRYSKQFGLVLLDLRGFRKINDALGLQEGDELLGKVAATLQKQIRSNDSLCRYSGDRFALVVPECDEANVQKMAGKLQNSLKRIDFPSRTKLPPLSATCASAHYPADGNTEAELVSKLFGRLEAAKQKASGARA